MIHRVIRRGALLLVASALAAGPFVHALPAAADDKFQCAAGQPCVHITFPDGGHDPVDVPASVIENHPDPDVDGKTYTIEISPGNTSSEQITTGLSVRTLLSSVIPDPIDDLDQVTYTLAQNPTAAYQSPLRPGDLSPSSPFYEGLEPALDVQGGDNNQSIEYIRPQRTADDVNAEDVFQTGSQLTTIDLQVHTKGALIHPTVTVGPGTPFHVNDPVPLTATLASDDPQVSSANYRWTFARGDPPQLRNRSTTYHYQAGGLYIVSVVVSAPAPDGGAYYGQSPGVSIEIGKAKTTPPPKIKSTPSTGSSTHAHTTSGPTKASGHHEGEVPTGGRTPTPASTDSATSAQTGSSGTSTVTGSGVAQTPAGSAAPTAGAGGLGSETPSPGSGDAGGEFVRGVLIDGVAALAGGARASAEPQAAEAASQPSGTSASLDPRWLWVLAPVALLALGALGERRRVPHRHGPQSRT